MATGLNTGRSWPITEEAWCWIESTYVGDMLIQAISGTLLVEPQDVPSTIDRSPHPVSPASSCFKFLAYSFFMHTF